MTYLEAEAYKLISLHYARRLLVSKQHYPMLTEQSGASWRIQRRRCIPMMNDHKTILKNSDWVKGISRHGELIIGFIDSMNIFQEAVYVVVAESDNEELIGKTIPMSLTQVESIPDNETKDAGQLEFLIDLALSTGDKEWFNELSAELNGKKQSVN